LITYSKKNMIKLDQMGYLRDKDKVEFSISRLKKSWRLYENIPGENNLLKAVVHAFR
jgi:hypothetical protein